MPEKITDTTLMGNVFSEWVVEEYQQHKRNRLWYILMGSVGFVLVLSGIFTGNFLFSLIIILFAIILFLQSHEKPQRVAFKIAELGVIVGDRFYPYTELNEFYINFNPLEDAKTLFIEPQNSLRPTLRVPMQDQNPLKIKQILLQYIPENIEKKEPLSDRLARNWMFH